MRDETVCMMLEASVLDMAQSLEDQLISYTSGGEYFIRILPERLREIILLLRYVGNRVSEVEEEPELPYPPRLPNETTHQYRMRLAKQYNQIMTDKLNADVPGTHR
jgi:hypothetical protein